jgi:redox-sensing transcriptional repressor
MSSGKRHGTRGATHLLAPGVFAYTTVMAMETSRPGIVPNPAVRRLSLYLRHAELLKKKDRRTVSSKQLGVALGCTDAQVRKDLAYFGQFGQPGVGYEVESLIERIRRILATDRIWDVVLVGAGNLGRALLAHRGFDAKGFRIVALFDSDATKIGRTIHELPVQPIREAADYVRHHPVRLAILAVPAEVAQDVADDLVAAGIRGILNFAPVALSLPSHVAVNSVDLAVQLEQLSFLVNASTAR